MPAHAVRRSDVQPLAQRIVAESLGTAFLLAGVVGSGIMAAKLAGGNGALALLCNTLPTGAILTVLILTFGPVSGAHFNPAVSIALALRRELSPSIAALYIGAQLVGAIAGVWSAHLMFELPLWQLSGTVRTGSGPMVRGRHRDVRAVADDLRMRCTDACRHPLCRWPLHHGCVLVYRVNIVCQSCGDDRTRSFGYLCGDCASRRDRVHRRTASRDACGGHSRPLALAKLSVPL